MQKQIVSLVIVILLIGFPRLANCQFVQDGLDGLAADTVDLRFPVTPRSGGLEAKLQIDLYIFNDSNTLNSASMGYTWDFPGLVLDSAIISPLADSSFDFIKFLYYGDNRDSTNSKQLFMFAGVRIYSSGLFSLARSRLWASYYFTVNGWNEGDSIIIDTTTFSPGTYLTFTRADNWQYTPFSTGQKVIYDIPCCNGSTGNVDGDAWGRIDIADLTYLIDHLFINFSSLPCAGACNIDADGGIDIADLTLLIDHLFINFAPLGACK